MYTNFNMLNVPATNTSEKCKFHKWIGAVPTDEKSCNVSAAVLFVKIDGVKDRAHFPPRKKAPQRHKIYSRIWNLKNFIAISLTSQLEF